MAPIAEIVTVQAGGKVELTAPELREGDVVRVEVRRVASRTLSLAETLRGAAAQSERRTAAEVDAYIRELRDEWD